GPVDRGVDQALGLRGVEAGVSGGDGQGGERGGGEHRIGGVGIEAAQALGQGVVEGAQVAAAEQDVEQGGAGCSGGPHPRPPPRAGEGARGIRGGGRVGGLAFGEQRERGVHVGVCSWRGSGCPHPSAAPLAGEGADAFAAASGCPPPANRTSSASTSSGSKRQACTPCAGCASLPGGAGSTCWPGGAGCVPCPAGAASAPSRPASRPRQNT